MRKGILTIISIWLGLNLYGQSQFRLGIESGIIRSNYSFRSSTAPSAYSRTTNGTVALRIGFARNGLAMETGIGTLSNRSPQFVPAELGSQIRILDPKSNFTIEFLHFPLNVGYEFKLLKERLAIIPKAGFGLLHSLNGKDNISQWHQGPVSIEQAISGNIPHNPGVTIAYGYRKQTNVITYQMGVDAFWSLSANLQIGIGGCIGYSPIAMYQETVTHYTDSHPVEGKVTQCGLQAAIHFGIRAVLPFKRNTPVNPET